MMIMGATCTRACSFCNVATGKPKGVLHTTGGYIFSGFNCPFFILKKSYQDPILHLSI